MVIHTLQKALWSVSGDEDQRGHGLYMRVFTQLNNTNKLNKALKAIREQLTMARTSRGFDWNPTCNRLNTAVASSCYPSNHVFTPQLPNPIGLPSYSQINYSNFTPANFSLNFLDTCHLIWPQLLSSPNTLDLACDIFQYLFIACLIYFCLNGYLSISWGTNRETRCGESLSLVLTSFIHLCHSFPSLC